MNYVGLILILIFIVGLTFLFIWFLEVIPLMERVAAAEMRTSTAEARIKLMESDLQDAYSSLEKTEKDLQTYIVLLQEKENQIKALKEQIQKLEQGLDLQQ